jgi:hypothetical protein
MQRGAIKLSSGSFATVGFHGPILIGTARRQRALSLKTALAPATAKTSPPKAGPTIVEMFSCSPVKVDAEGSCSSDTISGTRAEKAAALSANPSRSEILSRGGGLDSGEKQRRMNGAVHHPGGGRIVCGDANPRNSGSKPEFAEGRVLSGDPA